MLYSWVHMYIVVHVLVNTCNDTYSTYIDLVQSARHILYIHVHGAYVHFSVRNKLLQNTLS